MTVTTNMGQEIEGMCMSMTAIAFRWEVEVVVNKEKYLSSLEAMF